MSAAECPVAQLQTFIQNLPEFIHISIGRTCHIYKIDRYNSLIETSIELMASVRISLLVLNCQK